MALVLAISLLLLMLTAIPVSLLLLANGAIPASWFTPKRRRAASRPAQGRRPVAGGGAVMRAPADADRADAVLSALAGLNVMEDQDQIGDIFKHLEYDIWARRRREDTGGWPFDY